MQILYFHLLQPATSRSPILPQVSCFRGDNCATAPGWRTRSWPHLCENTAPAESAMTIQKFVQHAIKCKPMSDAAAQRILTRIMIQLGYSFRNRRKNIPSPPEPPIRAAPLRYTRPIYSGNSPSAVTTTSSGSRARLVSICTISSLPIRRSQAS